MKTDPNIAEPAVVEHFYPIRRCLTDAFEYQPLLMGGLVVALGISVWLVGLRILGCFRRTEPEERNPFQQSWAGLLEFALGRMVLAGILVRTCVEMITLAYTSSQGAALRLPLAGLTSLDVYLLCTPLLVASMVYANCTVAGLIGRMRGRRTCVLVPY